MSKRPLLVIGNRNYSSWSLRGYLALAAAGIEFDEKVIQLDTPTTKAELAASSPSAKVPALIVGEVKLWETLAIAEWAAERSPQLWPEGEIVRAHARSSAAQMHADFAALRGDMPMNIRGRFPGVGHSPSALKDVERITTLWREARRLSGGRTFLYGDDFGAADAMYAPVVTRLITYDVALEADLKRYMDAVCAYLPMSRWIEGSRAEAWECPVCEPSSPQWQGGPLLD